MVERLYPDVYLTEIAFRARPIDGVSTTTTPMNALHAAAPDARGPGGAAPDWTDHDDNDPGITLVQLAAWLNESMLFSASAHPAARTGFASIARGVAEGLAVEGRDPARSDGLKVTPGSAANAEGRAIEAESTTIAWRIRKP